MSILEFTVGSCGSRRSRGSGVMNCSAELAGGQDDVSETQSLKFDIYRSFGLGGCHIYFPVGYYQAWRFGVLCQGVV